MGTPCRQVYTWWPVIQPVPCLDYCTVDGAVVMVATPSPGSIRYLPRFDVKSIAIHFTVTATHDVNSEAFQTQ